MTSFVSDPKVEDNIEYTIVVSRNSSDEAILFLCSSQKEIKMKINAEIGSWYLYNGDKLCNRIKPPVPTSVFTSSKGQTVVQVTVPVVYLNHCDHLKLPYEPENVLLSPVLGLVGAMFTTNLASKFNQSCLYEIKAFWLSNTLLALRKIKEKGMFFWAADGNSIKPISDKDLVIHPYLKHMSCLRVSIVETLFCLKDSINVNYYAAVDITIFGQPVVVINGKSLEYGENLTVFVLPVHMNDPLTGRKILNIAIELNNDNFEFTNKINYEPMGALAIDYHQQQPIRTNGNTNGTSNANGTSKKPDNKLDFKKAVTSKAPPAMPTTKIGSSSSSNTSSTDGFHVVKKTKRREKVVGGQAFDESRYAEVLEEPEANKIYKGVIVSQDAQHNYYIYCPTFPYEIQLAAATEIPSDLKISDFVEFKCNMLNVTYYYTRPSAEFVKKIPQLFKCGMLKNSVFLHCKLYVPPTFKNTNPPVVFTDFVPRVADKNGLLTSKDAGKEFPNVVITRTKNTGIENVFWLIHKLGQ